MSSAPGGILRRHATINESIITEINVHNDSQQAVMKDLMGLMADTVWQ